MEQFDSNSFLDKLKTDFRKTDKRIIQFKDNFIHSVFLELRTNLKSLALDDEMKFNLGVLADEIWNVVESVIYKDASYPEYRMKEEVELLHKVIIKRKENENGAAMHQHIHKYIKKLVVNEFTDIQDLSSDGFRLLETYTKLYCSDFLSSIKKQSNEYGFHL